MKLLLFLNLSCLLVIVATGFVFARPIIPNSVYGIANGKLQLVIAAFQPCKGKIKKWKLPNNSQKNEN